MPTHDSQFCQCLFFAAGAFARSMNRRAEEAFAPTGLSPSHAFVVMAVNRKPGISPSDLSAELMLTPSTITRLMEKLESKGLIERRVSGRAVEVHPTDASRAVDADIRSAWKGLYDAYSALLGEEEANRLTSEIYAAVKTLG